MKCPRCQVPVQPLDADVFRAFVRPHCKRCDIRLQPSGHMWFCLLILLISVVGALLIAWRLYVQWSLNDFNLFLVIFAAIGGVPIFVSGYLIWSSEYVATDEPWA